MKRIKLENFRCYDNIEINFKRGINLLIGDNASGKTSILKACRYVLGSFFSGFSDENTNQINLSKNDFREIINREGVILPELPIKIHFNVDNLFDEYCKQSNLFDEYYILEKRKKDNSRTLTSGYSEYKSFAKGIYETFIDFNTEKQIKALPLFACFSTEDIHSTRKITSSEFKKYHQKNSFGYYECLNGNGFLPYWLKRLLVLQEGQKNIEEIEIVRNSIIKVLGESGCGIIKDIDIRPVRQKVYFIFSDGRETEAEKLSDGYRRLVNIVVDISFRCALLNRSLYGNKTSEKTKGVVLIDEIDMHLHPSLQASVLKSLRLGFPNIQFIATTHAPMVMSGVKNNEENIVYKLDYNNNEEYSINEINTYGLDVSTIVDIAMDQVPRDESVEKKLRELFDYIDNDEIDCAKEKLQSLKNDFGDKLPELFQAEAMLNCELGEDNDKNN